MRTHLSIKSASRRAQSLVELAIVLPLLVLLLLGAIDYGRVFFYFQEVESAAAAGAQIGCLSSNNALNTTLITSNALLQVADMSNLSPVVTTLLSGSNLSVTVSATFRPFIAWPYLPTNVPMQRTVQMRILQ